MKGAEALFVLVFWVAHDGVVVFVELVRNCVATDPRVTLNVLQVQSPLRMVLQQTLN